MSVEGPGGLKRVQKVCRGSRVFRELRGSVEDRPPGSSVPFGDRFCSILPVTTHAVERQRF